jgi:lipoate---protein ligase
VTWHVTRLVGTADELHHRSWPEPLTRTLWLAEVTRPAIALGSAQSIDLVDSWAAMGAGIDVVKRRSGGGAVWLAPGAQVWADVFIGRDDPLWVDDIGESMHWLGEVWVEALSALGLQRLAIHRDGLVRNQWSSLVCFASLGPGEVTWRGAKAVGISQRRVRAGARFQCSALLHWPPTAMLDLLGVGRNPELVAAARALPVTAAELNVAFLASLSTR